LASAIIFSKGITRAATLAVAAMFLSIAAWPDVGVTERELDQAQASVQRMFGKETKAVLVTIPLLSQDKEAVFILCNQRWGGDTLVVLASFKGNAAAGYAVVDNVKGKDQLITYIVAVDSSLVVKDLEILAYREAYGGEVRYKSWQKQFFGRRPGEELRPGKEIKNISGATISARSVTFGVKKVLSVLAAVRDRLPHTPLETQ